MLGINQNYILEGIKGTLNKLKECLPPFSTETFIFQPIKKSKDPNAQNCNFTCCVYGCKTWSASVNEERSAGDNIWTSERRNRKTKKNT
jgi:hypothetical protein